MRNDRNKVLIEGDLLIIGNGYDRVRGIESDYNSFIDHFIKNNWKEVKRDCKVIFNLFLIQNLINSTLT